MILDITKSVYEQIETAKAEGKAFAFDLRMEAMGDKCAAIALISWLTETFKIEITVIESEPGRTEFMLRDHWWPDDDSVKFRTMEPLEALDELDLHTTGQALPCLWEFNSLFATQGYRRLLPIDRPEHSSSVVFAIRSGAEYDERKNMNLECARQTIDELKRHLSNVVVLYDVADPMFPEALNLPMRDALKHIESCRVFIGGDTGFSHYAAACGVPQIGIYPDYGRFGKPSWAKAEQASNWWGMPKMRFTPFNCLPNSNMLRVATLGTDHRWSIDQVMESIRELA